MLRCRGAGLLAGNARLHGERGICSGRRLLLLASDPRPHREVCANVDPRGSLHQRCRLSTSLSRMKPPRKRQAKSENTGMQPSNEPLPLSEFEYERSLWEASSPDYDPSRIVASENEAVETSESPDYDPSRVPGPVRAATEPTETPPERHRPLDRVSSSQNEVRSDSKDFENSGDDSLARFEAKSKSPVSKPKSKKAKSGEPGEKRTGPKSRLQQGPPVKMKAVRPYTIKFEPVNEGVDLQIPRLAHNLDRTLFNPGVVQLQDPRSKVFNFDPYLTSIMPVDEFDFDALREYVSSSKDEKLHEMSKQHNSKYCGSTSSMTSVLSHFHYLISHWRMPAFPSITKSFEQDSQNFTQLTRAPAATFIHHRDGVYAMDADKEYDFGRENILMMLGHSMEKLLTVPPEEFENYRRDRSHLISQEAKNAGSEAFHYGTIGKFMMRSQLDAQDPRLPGTGVFDIKTRAVLPIRIDLNSYKDHVGYEIKDRFGQVESFEREYYDLIRAAFLRYSLQVRIGRMDGAFVAYHNTRRIFGFQYVSLNEMDQALHGTSSPWIGDQEFRLSVEMLESLLDMATDRYPGRKLQIHVETRDTSPPVMYFFARPVGEDEIRKSNEQAMSIIDKTQSAMERARAESEKLAEEDPAEGQYVTAEEEEAAVLDEDSTGLAEGNPVWEEMIAKVEEVVENEAMGVDSVRDAVHHALHEKDWLNQDTKDEMQPSIEALVEALLAERPSSREPQETTAADPSDVDAGAEAQEVQGDNETHIQAQTESSEPTPQTDIQEDMDPVAARTQELKELILKFSKCVDLNATQAQGFERALGELLARVKTQTGSSGTEAAEEVDEAADEVAEQTAEEEAAAVEQLSKRPEKSHRPKERNYSHPEELFSAVVSVVNTQKGKPVPRPVHIEGGNLDWTAHYTIHEMGKAQAEAVYPAMKKRRWDIFGNEKRRGINDRDREKFLSLSRQGARRRREEDAKSSSKPYFVAWDNKPQPRKENGSAGS